MAELEFTETSNPVKFEWWLTGPQGARYCLYPVKGKHTEEDAKWARIWLYHNHDVVSIQVRWVSGDNVAPPEKIPDLVIIKELRVEVGKLKSYIDELESKFKKDLSEEKIKLNNDVLKKKSEVMKEQLYIDIKKENTKLKKEIIKLKESISQLMYRINKLENTLLAKMQNNDNLARQGQIF